MHRLSARDLRRSRPHLLVLRVAWTVVAASVLVSLIVSSSAVDFQRPALWSPGYVAFGLTLTVIAGGGLVWYAPRSTLAASMAVAVFGAVAVPGEPGAWWAVATLAAALLSFLLVRDSRSRPTGGLVVPRTDVPFASSWAASPALNRWIGVASMIALPVVGVALLIAHQVFVADVAAFEAGATTVSAPIVRVEEDSAVLIVSVDGQEVEFEDPWLGDGPGIGETVDLLTDGAGRATLIGPGQDNPAWLLGALGALPLIGVALWGRFLAPGRRRAALVANGGPSATVRVVCDGDVALVLPVDADWPVLELTHLDGHADRAGVLAVSEKHESAWDDEDEDVDSVDVGQPLPANAADLAAWVDGVRDEIESEDQETMTSEEKILAEAVVGPDTNGAEPFILVGSWASGHSVALARTTGQVWLAEASEPRPFQGRRRLLGALRPETPGWDHVDDAAAGPAERLQAWALRHASWTRWAAACGVAMPLAVLIPWLALDPTADWWDLARVAGLAVAAVIAPFWATSWSWLEFGRVRAGFAWYGLAFDEVVARDRVEIVVAGRTAVAVRLRDPDDVIGFDPEVLIEGESSAERAAVELRSWVEFAPAGSRSGRRPAPGLVAALALVVAWAAQLIPAWL
ncbi:hypothetical protein [Tessaracoccus sp. Z1128]